MQSPSQPPRPTPPRGPWVLLWLVVFWCGCRTGGNFAPLDVSGPHWRTQTGQAVWIPKKGGPELAGEVMLAEAENRALIHFSKPPLTIVEGRLELGRWQVKFGADRRYSGRGSPPGRLGWLHLPSALAGKPLPKPWRFERSADGNWTLSNSKTGESISGYLQ